MFTGLISTMSIGHEHFFIDHGGGEALLKL
jgi:hypothetical protein